jgi:hypothetical protein
MIESNISSLYMYLYVDFYAASLDFEVSCGEVRRAE